MNRSRENAGRTVMVMVLLASCLCAALPLRAEEDGRGAMAQAASIDVWDAVFDSRGLELRDRVNRPISRAALAAELRKGTAQVLREGAVLSRLPGLKTLLDYLDHLRLRHSAVGGERPARGPGEAALALAPSRSPKVRALVFAALWKLPDLLSARIPSPLHLTSTPGRIRVLPLLL